MRKILTATVVAAVTASVTVTLVWAAFTSSQSASGEVSVATSNDVALYICEPIGGEDEVIDPAFKLLCPGDDSGRDEVIFDATEKALPGDTVVWDIRLRNDGSFAWDVSGVATSASNSIGGGTCPNSLGLLDYSILGKASDSANDNHLSPSYTNSVVHAATAEILREGLSATDKAVVHVEPGDFEDIRLRFLFSESAPNGCKGSVWSVGTGWTISNH